TRFVRELCEPQQFLLAERPSDLRQKLCDATRAGPRFQGERGDEAALERQRLGRLRTKERSNRFGLAFKEQPDEVALELAFVRFSSFDRAAIVSASHRRLGERGFGHAN